MSDHKDNTGSKHGDLENKTASVKPHLEDTAPKGAPIKPQKSVSPPGAEPTFAGSDKTPSTTNAKLEQLDAYREDPDGQALRTDQGIKISDNQNSLKAGARGSTLLEDFILREKITHFDHERIPERIVHARGAAAHGYFQVYQSLHALTKAGFLTDPGLDTPVFVRFSTVQGARGSADSVRDIRGFATKFYTQEGNFDLVGNNTPIFFIQDAIKFPDFVHAVKPEPHNEIPQGQSAHDTFWDYVSLQPETLHNVMWAMSDRGIPRSYRMMEGFGIHCYKLINAEGKSHFVRFHWKPTCGAASLIWDEAQVLTGRDPDFHRRELWESIEAGDFPEFELGLQIIPEEDEFKYDFDILDPTKLIPESLVPVQIVGKMVLNRNPDNYFSETEQVAFCPGNIVPGLDFSDDPLLQGRLFSYLDTQISRLGGPNFHEIPINKPVCPFHNHQRDGMHRMGISGKANYEPNSINNNWPRETPPAKKDGGFATSPQPLNGQKVRVRSESFNDYYSQPRLFWQSQTQFEQDHIVGGFSFELGKVVRPWIRERVVDELTYIDGDLAARVAANIGLELSDEQRAHPIPKDVNGLKKDDALSLYGDKVHPVKSRQVAILVADGVCGDSVEKITAELNALGIHTKIFAPRLGKIKTLQGKTVNADGTIEGNPSVLVDGVIVATGKASIEALKKNGNAKNYLLQAFKHLKAIGLQGDALKLYEALPLPKPDEGVIVDDDAKQVADKFIEVLKKHRVWSREAAAQEVPA
ncbi:catalase HPII [Rouxiella badensis]|jgi:catalase|uniref:catalase HPII n=1 Tax=Rouxiella badensis TaxID=1646377 RepID=UPI001D1597A0|nr:catalase HPII [Rouxiella badensis]MCC3719083.1 catalase HPII [Rouxiella badensis]MCC3729137.1 catalase HPII [Rouxiella badensis]MCC3733670.1 catalase HPII [Rouxiella badensis]MCC3740688.1 catalase HPII [Rouxiella badensis]MCC3759676.1 catalase HPII [Rouxiella badensis]